MKRFFAAVLALCMTCLCLPALAQTAFIPQLDAWGWTGSARPAEVTVSAQADALVPFDEGTLTQLNTLLRHLSLQVKAQSGSDGDWGRIALLVDGAETAWLASRTLETGGTLVSASFQPGAEYTSGIATPTDAAAPRAQDAMELLLGRTETDVLLGLDGASFSLPDAARALIPVLGTLAEAQRVDKDVSKSVQNMGKAKRQTTITLTAEEAAALAPALARETSDEALCRLLASLVFSKEQKLVLLFDGSGAPLSVQYTGRCGTDSEDMRKVSITWTMKDDGEEARDVFKLTSPALSGTNKDSVTWTQVVKAGEKRTLDMTLTYVTVHSKEKTTIESEAALTFTQGTTLEGTAWVKQTLPDDSTESWKFTPALTFGSGADKASATGTVRAVHKLSSTIAQDVTLTLTAAQTDAFGWLAAQEQTALDLIPDAELAALQKTAAEALAAPVVQALLRLPREDLAFLLDGLDETALSHIFSALK